MYRDGKDRWFGWEKHALYNQRLEAEVIKIKRDEFWIGPQVDLFDIYWMTALRRDGHPSEKDCLHYLLPGPPDWWNHRPLQLRAAVQPPRSCAAGSGAGQVGFSVRYPVARLAPWRWAFPEAE